MSRLVCPQKDSSQETIISLFGMLVRNSLALHPLPLSLSLSHRIQVGSVVVSQITGFKTTWAALLLLLASHLSLNYAAVRSVQMTSLNRQRASMVFSTIVESDNYTTEKQITPKDQSPDYETDLTIPTPAQIASSERILHKGDPFFWSSFFSPTRQSLGTAKIGVSLAEFFACAHEVSTSASVSASNTESDTSSRTTTTTTTSTSKGTTTNPTRTIHTTLPLKRLQTLFEKESYLFYLFPSHDSSASSSSNPKWHASIILKPTATTRDQLKAWCHALIAARALSEPEPVSTERELGTRNKDAVFGYIAETLGRLNEQGRFEGYLSGLSDSGWDIDAAALEVRAGRRVIFRGCN